MKLLIVGEPREIAELLQDFTTPELAVTDKVPGLDTLPPSANAPVVPLMNDTNAHEDGWHPWTASGQPGEAK